MGESSLPEHDIAVCYNVYNTPDFGFLNCLRGWILLLNFDSMKFLRGGRVAALLISLLLLDLRLYDFPLGWDPAHAQVVIRFF